jgi:hypothetical protein
VCKHAYECVTYTNIAELISRFILIPRSCLYAPWFWRYSILGLQIELCPAVSEFARFRGELRDFPRTSSARVLLRNSGPSPAKTLLIRSHQFGCAPSPSDHPRPLLSDGPREIAVQAFGPTPSHIIAVRPHSDQRTAVPPTDVRCPHSEFRRSHVGPIPLVPLPCRS